MEFKEIIKRRRSTRKFEAKKVEKDKIERILGAVFTAPSSKNTRSTRIAVSADPQVLEAVSGMRSFGSSFANEAATVFFVMGDETETDLWRENAAISATLLQLAAEDEGLASCWIHVHGRLRNNDDPQGQTAEEYLHEKLPQLKPYGILCVIAAGYPEMRLKQHEPAIDPERVMYL